MSEIIKDENVDLRLKIHGAAVNMQAYKHALEMMDLTFGVDNVINSLNRYREDTLNSIRKAHRIASFCDKVTVLPIILYPKICIVLHIIHLKPYTKEEFVEIAVNVLNRDEGLEKNVAKYTSLDNILCRDVVFNP